MKLIHKTLLAFGIFGASCVFSTTIQPAYAQPTTAVFESAGFLEIISGGEVVGDGRNTVKLHVLALNPDGTPMTGLKLRANASGGTITAPTEVGPSSSESMPVWHLRPRTVCAGSRGA